MNKIIILLPIVFGLLLTNFIYAKRLDSNIHQTPPAPQFSDAERQTELAQRRTGVGAALAEDSILILFSTEPRIYTGDVDFYYRQENNFYYLTNLKQKNAALVLIKSGSKTQEILFLPDRQPAQETWTGRMYSREDASRISGLKTIVSANEFEGFLNELKARKKFESKDKSLNVPAFPRTLYLLLPENQYDEDGMREFTIEQNFARAATDYKILNAQPIFAALRLVKSPFEIKLLQHAVDITTEGLHRAMKTVGTAEHEYEVQAEVEYVFRRRNADYWGYPSIVGCGVNATTLHYEESQGAVKKGELMLMDVGAEYDHLTADVTRTFPVNGKFTAEQKAIYNIVYDAQEAAAAQIKPGSTFDKSSNAAVETLKNGLAKLGLITAPNASYQVIQNGQIRNVPQYRLWFMHGWGHWLGMNVHDVGDYFTPFKPGMVLTNEPGIYVRPDTLGYIPDTPANREFLAKIKPAYEKYKNIGVRIEDDMLVTENGVEWMTKALPRSVKEIEDFMAKPSIINSLTQAHPPNSFDIAASNTGGILKF